MIRHFNTAALLLWIFSLSSYCLANPSEIISLLREGRIDELSEIKDATTDEIEKLFLKAVFENDGKRAAELFTAVWKQYPNNHLGWESLSRLYEYYYAQGAYLKADSLAQTLGDRPQIELTSPPPQRRIETFWVQVGAFSEFINAANLNVRLEGMGYSVTIQDKMVNDKMLYVVMVGGFHQQSEVDSVSRAIEKKLPLKTKVITEER